MDELDRRLSAARDRLHGRITPPPADHVIARARRRRTQRRAQVAVVGLVAALAIAVPVASLVGGRHRAEPAGQPSTVTVPTTVTVTGTPPAPSGQSRSGTRTAAGGGASSMPVTAATTITAGRPVLGISGDYELFARSTDSVARIRFAQGTVSVKPAPPVQSGAGAFFVVGTHAVIARPWDYVSGFLMPDDGPATDLPGALSGGGGNVFPGPQPDQVWVEHTSNGAESGVDALRLVDFHGTKTTSFPLTGSPLAPDGHGYVLVRGTTCLYDARPDGRTCIASGASLDVAAIGPTGWLLHPCADGKRCTDVYVDRATGTKRDVSTDIDPEQWGIISPDGSVAAIVEPGPDGSDTGTLHLIDLASGTDRTVSLASNPALWPSHGAGMVWSPDGRWLFVAAGRLLAIDPGSGQSHTLPAVPGDARFIQVGIRTVGDGGP